MTRMEVAFTAFFAAFLFGWVGLALFALLQWVLPPEPEMHDIMLSWCCSAVGFFLGGVLVAEQVKK